MKRIKLHIFFLILLCMTLLTCSSCSISPDDATDYSKTQLLSGLNETLYKGGNQYTVKYSSDSVSEDEINNDLDSILKSDYLSLCLLDSASVSLHKKLFYTEAEFSLTYTETGSFKGKIHDVDSPKQLQTELDAIMKDDISKAPILLKGCTFTEDELFSFLSNAEVNCASAPCEAVKISYAAYEPKDYRQLIIVQAEYPIDDDTMKEKKAELASAVSEKAESLELSKSYDTAYAYERVYDLICHGATYDEALSSSTLNDNDRLTDEMHINRSAYGALITGKTVCTGYARGFKAICDELGLPCHVMIGTKDEVPHAWNAVTIDGETLYIDCTAGAAGEKKEEAFLFTSQQAHSRGYESSNDTHIPW